MTTKPKNLSAKGPIRRQGRPRRSEAAVGKEAIVEAARKLLRQVPPAKITRLAVARAAGVDPNLVRYYFGDMTELLSNVVEAIVATMRGKLEISVANPDLSPAEKLRQRVRILLDTFVENPHFHQLFVELVLYRDKSSVKHLRRSIVERSLSELEGLLAEVGATDLDPRFVYISLFGILEFFVTAQPILEVLYPKHVIGSKKLQNEYAEFVGNLFFGRFDG
jgi:AcrR family transcriptional regulator